MTPESLHMLGMIPESFQDSCCCRLMILRASKTAAAVAVKPRFAHQPRFKHYDSSTKDSRTKDSRTNDSRTTRFTHQRFTHYKSPIQAPKRHDSSTKRSRFKHQKEPIQAPEGAVVWGSGLVRGLGFTV